MDFGENRMAGTSCCLRFIAKRAGMDGADTDAATAVDMAADAARNFLLCEWNKMKFIDWTIVDRVSR